MDHLEKFIVDFFNQDIPNSKILTSAVPLWGDSTKTKNIFIRDVYEERCAEVLEKEYGRVLIGGSKGIGKSIFGTYLVLLFLKRKKRIVVYQREKEVFVMIPASATANAKEALSIAWMERFKERLLMDDSSLTVFALNGTLADIPRLDGLVFVVDQETGEAEIPAGGSTLQILVSSPRTLRVSNFTRNQTHLLRIYLPVWTLGEMKRCYELTGRLNKHDKKGNKEYGGEI